MMRKVTFLLALSLTAKVLPGLAQDYDSDSAYYSPIPKPQPKREWHVLPAGPSAKVFEYFFIVQMGTLIGCNDCPKGKDFTFSAATVHGVAIGQKLRTGIGLGFDSYQNWQTLPVYGMVSWDLIGSKGKNTLFVQMSYGWSHPWFVRDGAYATYVSDPFYNIKGGRMMNPEIGYRLKYYNLRVSLAAGFHFQRISYETRQYSCPYCEFASPPLTKVEITQDMNRVELIMTVGWK